MSEFGSRIACGNTAYSRAASDFYPTPPEVTSALMNFLMLPCSHKIWEPACGENHMVNVMRDRGYDVIGTDINMGVDFLSAEIPEDVDWIITNPPFSLADSFVCKCVEHKKPFALLLKSQYWHAKKRLQLFREHPPAYVLPLTWRPDFLFGQRGGSPLMEVMWCVWTVSDPGRTVYEPLSKPGEDKADG